MNEQLIKLIELCLVDGVISDKEREVIVNKAESLGMSKEECEVILDSYEYSQKGNTKKSKSLGLKKRDFTPKKIISIPPAPLNMKQSIQIQLNELSNIKNNDKSKALDLIDKLNETNKLRVEEVTKINTFIEKAEKEILDLNKSELVKCFNTLTKNATKRFKNVYIINNTDKKKLTDYKELYLKEVKEIQNYILNAKWEIAKNWTVLKIIGVICFPASLFLSMSIIFDVYYFNPKLQGLLTIGLIILSFIFLLTSASKIRNHIKLTVKKFVENYDFSVFNNHIKNNEKLVKLKELTKYENNIETLSNTIKKL
tara:strand:- start:1012 stop:1947 length:936 start_codon:yes stop_codon:yes gene_type:complete